MLISREDLIGLEDAAWTLLRSRLSRLTVHIPASSASRAEQVNALWGMVQQQNAMPELEAAWADIQAALGKPRGDLDGWMRSLHGLHRNLRVIGLTGRDPDLWIGLSQLYIELDLARMREPELLRERGAEQNAGRGMFAPHEGRNEDRTLRAALVLASQIETRGVALIGLPGAGKTTALQRLWCDRYEAWQQDRGARAPLLVKCTSLRHLGIEGLRAGDLEQLAELSAWEMGYPGAGGKLFQQTQRLTVMLDGLDELASPEDRQRVAEWVIKETVRWPDIEFVVTCRDAAWDGRRHEEVAAARVLKARLLDFQIKSLAPASIHTYIERWFSHVHRKETAGEDLSVCEEAARRAVEQSAELSRLIRGATGAEGWRIHTLTGNPLMLSTVCLVFRRYGQLPRGRGKLYGKCLEVLLRGRRGSGAEAFDLDSGVRLLAPLAWAMQEGSDDHTSPKEVPKQQVLDALAKSRHLAGQTRTPEELMTALVQECCVLISPDGAQYQFIHLTFQEYLAIQQAVADNAGADLARRAADPRWREPILLAMSEPGLRRAFYEEMLRGPLQPHRALLEACWVEAQPDPAPFVAYLRYTPPQPPAPPGFLQRIHQWFVPPPPAPVEHRAAPEDLCFVLRRFRNTDDPHLRESIATLQQHPAPDVRALSAGTDAPATLTPEGTWLGYVDDPSGAVWRGGRLEPVRLGVGSRWRCETLGMEFVWVPPGSFLMGATRQPGLPGFDPEAFDNEAPIHEVHLPHGFWMGRFPVTNDQIRTFVEETGADVGSLRRAGFDAPEQPIVGITWYDALRFCVWASHRTRLSLSLPTEAEWEWAARGADGRRFPWGNEAPSLERVWFGAYQWKDGQIGAEFVPGPHTERVKATAPVGERPSGASFFGVEEMAGNVWEWCTDTYAPYPHAPQLQPEHAHRCLLLDSLSQIDDIHCQKNDTFRQMTDNLCQDSDVRVLRGGAWLHPARYLRATHRLWDSAGDRLWVIGFRLVVRPPNS